MGGPRTNLMALEWCAAVKSEVVHSSFTMRSTQLINSSETKQP